MPNRPPPPTHLARCLLPRYRGMLTRILDVLGALRSLETLFGKNMLRACKIVDERGVRRVTGAPRGRSLFLVGDSPLF